MRHSFQLVVILAIMLLQLPRDLKSQTRDENGLIQYYSFDSLAYPKLYDQSGNGIDGKILSCNVVPGKVGNALEFNTITSVVYGNIVPTVEHFTVMAWIKPYSYGTIPTENGIIIFEKTESYYMNIMSNSSGNRSRGKMRVGGNFQSADGKASKWEYLDSPDTIRQNVWTHAAFSFDGAMLRLYINGQKVSGKAILPFLKSNQYPMIWGAIQKGGDGLYIDHFHGLLDECKLFSKSLSDKEIQRYYLQTK